MPQLAPLNWFFLEMLFWIIILLIMIMLWWTKDKKYIIFKINKEMKMTNKKWTW